MTDKCAAFAFFIEKNKMFHYRRFLYIQFAMFV